jgi:GGDEF domain-containing protein
MPIACCYIDVVGFKPYVANYAREGQKRALEFVAQLLVGLTRTMGIYESFVAHMGGEHFVVLLQLEDYERFINTLVTSFDQGVKKLYSAAEVSQGFIMATDKMGRENRYPLMALSIGIAHNQFREYKSAKKMFEVLAQVRQKALPDGKSIYFVDRRRTDR